MSKLNNETGIAPTSRRVQSIDNTILLILLLIPLHGIDLPTSPTLLIKIHLNLLPDLDLLTQLFNELLFVGNHIEVQIQVQIMVLLVLDQVPIVDLVVNLTLFLHFLGEDVLVVRIAGFLVEGELLGVLVEQGEFRVPLEDLLRGQFLLEFKDRPALLALGLLGGENARPRQLTLQEVQHHIHQRDDVVLS